MTFFKIFFSDDRGVTLVEYGIAISVAIAVGTAALATLGGEIDGATVAVGTLMPG